MLIYSLLVTAWSASQDLKNSPMHIMISSDVPEAEGLSETEFTDKADSAAISTPIFSQ